MKIGRNELCPCGSGKKFKRCHMGNEEELHLGQPDEMTVEEMGEKITALPKVDYGRSREMVAALDLEALTGSAMGIVFVDLQQYRSLNLEGKLPGAVVKGRPLVRIIQPHLEHLDVGGQVSDFHHRAQIGAIGIGC